MRSLVVFSVLMLTSGCSHVGAEGASRQIEEARAVHTFVSSIGPYGHRLASANAIYQPRLPGLNPYFGR